MSNRPLRIVQWTTGKVATQSIKAILDRQDLELVGLYAFSKEKVGQDVGDLINPGWVDALVATASSICRDVNLVRVPESFNIGLWAADANQDVIGWGRPAHDPGHPGDLEKASLPPITSILRPGNGKD